MPRLRRIGGAFALTVLACSTPDTNIGPQDVVSLAISPANPAVILGDTIHLAAIATDSRGIQYIGPTIAWTSDNASVATVDATGRLVTLALGSATISAKATESGVTTTTTVTVTTAPTIALGTDSVGFDAIPGGPIPSSQAVLITNSGGNTLLPVVDSVVTVSGMSGWLSASVAPAAAPDSLILVPNTTALAPGENTATVWIDAPRATNAPQSLTVTYTLAVGPAAGIQMVAGDSQVTTAGSAVPVNPVVKVVDQYGNPVPGVIVQFAITLGGGSLGQAADTTAADGLASPGTWTLGASPGENQFTATVPSVATVTFTATGN